MTLLSHKYRLLYRNRYMILSEYFANKLKHRFIELDPKNPSWTIPFPRVVLFIHHTEHIRSGGISWPHRHYGDVHFAKV